MGCNTSQELKTKDATAAAAEADAVNNDEGATNEPIENGEVQHQTNGTSNSGEETASVGANNSSAHNHHQKNHSKSNSIITNGDANVKHAKDAAATTSSPTSSPTSPKQNGAIAMLNGIVGDYDMEEARKCDKAEISELNDADLGEDEVRRFDGRDEFVPETEVYIPQHHHHHVAQKFRRNPLKNLDLDFKFDVHSF